MTDTIAPALTPEEWKAALQYTIPDVLTGGVEFYVGDANAAFAAIAQINAALSDDDPRKITREDVMGLMIALERMKDAEDWFHDQETPSDVPQRAENERKFAAECAAVASLKEKLAALLPPPE